MVCELYLDKAVTRRKTDSKAPQDESQESMRCQAPQGTPSVPYPTWVKVAGGGDRSSASLSPGSREALPTTQFFQAWYCAWW